ncbi:MAG: M48 family metallopeptidase [Imperialibacter sp.]|uniref:M48 family metallopeptidase n=1 Tax=Imperialibacter sp. TaxID=2038411 RepID=UPI0032EAAE49
MEKQTILWILLGIILLDFIVEEVLSYLNRKSSYRPLPNQFKDIYDEEKYQKSLAYQRDKEKFSSITTVISFVATLALLLTGGFGMIDGWLRAYTDNEVTLALSFFAVLYFASDLLTLPFQLYNVFVIEEKYGFNKTTPKTFVLDKLKGYLLTIIFGGLLVGILIVLILFLGKDFWIYFWGVMVVFMLLANLFYTSVIVPLFNKLTPLADGTLREAITKYSQGVNFPLTNIFVIDGSKRSSKANAYFSGLGKKKKIVLFDTLLEKHTEEELVAVLAHEVGHYKKKHIIGSLVLGVLQTGVMLYLLSLLIFNSQVSFAMGGNITAIHLNLLAFGILYSPVSRILGILMNVLSRKNEFEADAYAAETYEAQPLATALKKLSVDSLSNLFPHPWYVFVHYSHPPMLKRLERLESGSNA